jgi:hypothetical protein
VAGGGRQSEHYFQPYIQLKRQICPIFMAKLSKKPMDIYVQKKVDIFGKEHIQHQAAHALLKRYIHI